MHPIHTLTHVIALLIMIYLKERLSIDIYNCVVATVNCSSSSKATVSNYTTTNIVYYFFPESIMTNTRLERWTSGSCYFINIHDTIKGKKFPSDGFMNQSLLITTDRFSLEWPFKIEFAKLLHAPHHHHGPRIDWINDKQHGPCRATNLASLSFRARSAAVKCRLATDHFPTFLFCQFCNQQLDVRWMLSSRDATQRKNVFWLCCF